MKGLRNTTVWDFLNRVQTKAKSNVMRINQNNLKIEELRQLSKHENIESSEIVGRLRTENKELIEENSMLLNLHQKILAFSNEVKLAGDISLSKAMPEPKKEKSIDEEKYLPSAKECVDWVLDKYILLDDDHPCLCDDKIVDEIYNALVQNERYEECQLLLQLKERQNVKK